MSVLRWIGVAWAFGLIVGGGAAGFGSTPGQGQDLLRRRWVGTHLNEPLHLDFYGDTMVVVNDALVNAYRVSNDTLIVWGDTAFTVTFWFALDRLLLQTQDGSVITMAPQSHLARPLEGRWVGNPIGTSEETIELVLRRGGVARWRTIPAGHWQDGEWDRQTRLIQFTWLPDSTRWLGRYDPEGGALLFDSIAGRSTTLVLRRVYRWSAPRP